MEKSLLIAGFGGQGVMLMGQLLGYSACAAGKQVSFFPAYGAEQRGGTANCSVIVSDTPIGSPIVNKPDVLIAMNLPSLDKFEAATVAGGFIFVDSTLIGRKVEREDVKAFYIPATKMAADAGIPTLANMIMMGKMIKETGIVNYDDITEALKKVVSAKRANLMELNIKALEMGYNY